MTDEASVKRGGAGRAPHPQGPGAPQSRTRRILTLLAWGPAGLRSRAARWAVNGLALAGAALIVVSAIIHLRLWAQGYRGITVIGPLFLAQGVVSIPFAVVLGLFRRLGLLVAGAGLMAGTAAGLLLSTQIGLFGFKDSLAAPYAGLSLVVEFAGAALLAAGAVLLAAARPSPARRRTGSRRSG
jgi:hypothetical protein